MKAENFKDVEIKHKCPICGSVLVCVRYLRNFSELSISRKGEVMDMFGVNGEPLWEVVAERRFKGG